MLCRILVSLSVFRSSMCPAAHRIASWLGTRQRMLGDLLASIFCGGSGETYCVSVLPHSGLDQPVAIGIPRPNGSPAWFKLTEGINFMGFGHHGPLGLRSLFGGHGDGGGRGDGGDGGVVVFCCRWWGRRKLDVRSQNGTDTERLEDAERRGGWGKGAREREILRSSRPAQRGATTGEGRGFVFSPMPVAHGDRPGRIPARLDGMGWASPHGMAWHGLPVDLFPIERVPVAVPEASSVHSRRAVGWVSLRPTSPSTPVTPVCRRVGARVAGWSVLVLMLVLMLSVDANAPVCANKRHWTAWEYRNRAQTPGSAQPWLS